MGVMGAVASFTARRTAAISTAVSTTVRMVSTVLRIVGVATKSVPQDPDHNTNGGLKYLRAAVGEGKGICNGDVGHVADSVSGQQP